MIRRYTVAGLTIALAVVLLPLPVMGGAREPVGVVSGALALTRPSLPAITEPAANGQVVHPGDVHMATAPFQDADGQAHRCTTWSIHVASTGRQVWVDKCDASNKVHVHLGDGEFVGPYAGRERLKFGTKYVLRVRHRELSSARKQWSAWSERRFRTSARPPSGTSTVWTVRQEGFQVEVFAGGLTLPVDIAFVPNPPTTMTEPYFYVAELHGAIKVVARDGSVGDYYSNVLNYAPGSNFPGTGEQGLAGLVVEPTSGDVFASMLYQDSGGQLRGKVMRFHSTHGGAVADGASIVLDMPFEPMNFSHQISNLSIGPDGMLYVHVGDAFATPLAQNLDSFVGKVLRMTLDGEAPPDNPFYDAGNGINARDFVFASGLRNPFGGAWRAADGHLYMVENGPQVDRFAKIVAGRNYLWDGSNESMANYAIYNWPVSVAPINIAFVQASTFGGSGFPESKLDHAFVTESGPTYQLGPQVNGKRITEFVVDENGDWVSGPAQLIDYTGTGRASVAGLAAGPDGLYFTDLYRDQGATDATQCCAQVLRVRWVGE